MALSGARACAKISDGVSLHYDKQVRIVADNVERNGASRALQCGTQLLDRSYRLAVDGDYDVVLAQSITPGRAASVDVGDNHAADFTVEWVVVVESFENRAAKLRDRFCRLEAHGAGGFDACADRLTLPVTQQRDLDSIANAGQSDLVAQIF